MKHLLLYISIFSALFASGQEEILAIGLYRHIQPNQIEFTAKDCDFEVFVNDSLPFDCLKKGSKVELLRQGVKIQLIVNDESQGEYDNIKFTRTQKDGMFKVQTISPHSKVRTYYGDLEIKVINDVVTVINHVPIEEYLIGVIESESGNYQSKEYYKVQAIISRTYALKHKNKFLHEGFNLTDLVNCQVYFGKHYQNPKIKEAVEETKGLVLVDEDMNYITASFYSNSGGQTENSENVWGKKVSYLRSKADPFSEGKNNYKWTKSISKREWLNYLKSTYNYDTKDSIKREKVLNFTQTHRKKYLAGWDSHILLTDIRRDWRLKSTFFSIEEQGDKVILHGKGFGHGVGLSQEGAMNMVDLGYSYTDVLHFYYTNIYIIDYDKRNYYLME